MPGELLYQTLNPDEAETFRNVIFQTLNISHDVWDSFADRMGRENLRSLHKDGRLIGGLGVYRIGQWFGGRHLPCGGVALVGIAAEHRGRGDAAYLMQSALRGLHEEGVPLSTLYASTQRLYRKVGYEPAGTRCEYTLPLNAIGPLDSPLSLHQTDVTDSTPFHEPARRRASLTNGNLERTDGLWQRVLSFEDRTMYAYLIGDPREPQGYVIFYHNPWRDGWFDLHVRDMAAVTPAAARTLWAFIAGHRSVAASLHWCGPANEPLLAVPGECRTLKVQPKYWMLRIVDVPRALSGRGYPDEAAGALHLEIADDVLPANHGRFVLTVEGGEAEVRPGGRGDLRMDIRGLAPLFTGLHPPRTLQMLGQLEGDERGIAVATRLFAGPEPWMPEMF